MVRRTKEDAERTRQQIIDAARLVFHECGVSHTTLEKIAKAAGVTRGAVYWHFANKTELFFAMREQVQLPLLDRSDALLVADGFDNPLDGIEASMRTFFRGVDEDPAVRQTFEIMTLRCEYVGEFADVLTELHRPGIEFVAKLEVAYQRAAARGYLRPGLDPQALALDTWAFCHGLFKQLLASNFCAGLLGRVGDMISFHMALRRLPCAAASGAASDLSAGTG